MLCSWIKCHRFGQPEHIHHCSVWHHGSSTYWCEYVNLKLGQQILSFVFFKCLFPWNWLGIYLNFFSYLRAFGWPASSIHNRCWRRSCKVRPDEMNYRSTRCVWYAMLPKSRKKSSRKNVRNDLDGYKMHFFWVDFSAAPREGAYIHGLFMEGARWDIQSGIIMESRLKELFPAMPVINVRVWIAQFFVFNTLWWLWEILFPFLHRQLLKISKIFGICTNVQYTKHAHVGQRMYGPST